MSRKKQVSSFSKDILKQALIDSFKKFDPRIMIKNPVIFIVEIGFFLTLALTICPTLFSKEEAELRAERASLAGSRYRTSARHSQPTGPAGERAFFH